VVSAIENSVGAIGISVLSGAHQTIFPEIIELLKSKDRMDILVFGGGVIPEDDIPELLKVGVKVIFTPGTPLSTLTNWVIENLR
jgi:methylmalonyl-CoA mutase C-terminal domain/subunit